MTCSVVPAPGALGTWSLPRCAFTRSASLTRLDPRRGSAPPLPSSRIESRPVDEIVALRTLFERIDSGRWPDASPRRLIEAVRELGDDRRLVLDFGTFQDAPVPPAFTSFTPPEFLRPSS